MNRRNFLNKASLIAAGAAVLDVESLFATYKSQILSNSMRAKFNLSFMPYTLQLRHSFNLATSSRTTTPVVLLKLQFENYVGYGEASMPPYLGESQESVIRFLSTLDLSGFNDPFQNERIFEYINQTSTGNYAAKAAVDMAVNDLKGQILNKPLHAIWGFDAQKSPNTSFTIGIDSPEIVRRKIREAEPYKLLKIKLGRENDRETVELIRALTTKPLCVDVNQGWTDRKYALDMIQWLKEMHVIFVEQPMPKSALDDIAWLTQHSPLPIIADEAFQTYSDLAGMKGLYHGINIKLMKCGGLTPALKIANEAKQHNLRLMVGCMTETSCAVSAASQLAPLAEWADLDGNLLISNDIFEGIQIEDGKVMVPQKPGIGVIPHMGETEAHRFIAHS